MSIIEHIFGVIAPHECLACGTEGALLCKDCAQALPPVASRCYRCLRRSEEFATCKACRKQTPLLAAWPRTPYEGQAKELVHKLKFERALAVAQTIAEQLPFTEEWRDALVTYVPTANIRVRTRGYDQAALIAKAFARRHGLRHLPLLARINTERQVGQGRTARQKQANTMFRAINSAVTNNKQVMLIDDVITTGATCEAAARILRQAGASRVAAVVFAAA